MDFIEYLTNLIREQIEKIMKTQEQTSEGNVDNEKIVNSEEKQEIVNTDNEDIPTDETVVEEQEVKPVAIKYNEKTKLFEFDGEVDEAIRAELIKSNEHIKAHEKAMIEKQNQDMIRQALVDGVGKLKIIDNVSRDMVINGIDVSNAKIVDGKVYGVDEAIKAYTEVNKGLFVTDNKPVSNPILEGFNPQGAVQSAKNMSNIDLAMLAVSGQ